jgi:hypothetical protein
VVYHGYETAGGTCATEELYDSKELVLYSAEGEQLATTELNTGRITKASSRSGLEYCVFEFEYGRVPRRASYIVGDNDPEAWRSKILTPGSDFEFDMYIRWE